MVADSDDTADAARQPSARRPARRALEEGDREAQRYYARFAARWFAAALERDEVAPADRATMAYGLGELWCHIGDMPNGIPLPSSPRGI